MMEQPDVRYCMADDGVRLAYYVMGEGPPLVRASGIPSHLTAMWGIPGLADGTRMLAREHQVVTYDARVMSVPTTCSRGSRARRKAMAPVPVAMSSIRAGGRAET